MSSPTTTELALAMAILKGDRAAAKAAADLVIEEFNSSYDSSDKAIAEYRNNSTIIQGIELYTTDEFKALLKLLGVSWQLSTINMTIHVPCEGIVRVTQQVAGRRRDG